MRRSSSWTATRVVTEPGQIGEIGIVSPALAAGYFGDAKKTAAAFCTFCDHGRTLRLFRTGDMARYTPEGLLVFAARCDAQIKHMGYRIELGEIEAAANSLPEITGCACLYDTAKNRIVLFCTVQDGVTKASLRKALREKLSTYMIPSKIEILPQLPRNANGKTDLGPAAHAITVTPKGANTMEELLEVLRDIRDDIDYETEDNLIDGKVLDSFEIVTLVSEISDTFDITISAKYLVPEHFNSAKAMWDRIWRHPRRR